MSDHTKKQNFEMSKNMGNNISNRVFSNFDSKLPPNIYQNFSESTRDHKKEINYNINDRHNVRVKKEYYN